MKTDTENWKKLPSNNKYIISDLGRVQVLQRVAKDGRKFKQRFISSKLDYYGYYKVAISGKMRAVHQLVAETFLNHNPNGHKLVVDHINNVSTDNRLINLQVISQRKNLSKDKKGCTSKYVGVSWNATGKKWQSRIFIDGKSKHLGMFKCELLAAKAYNDYLNDYNSYIC